MSEGKAIRCARCNRALTGPDDPQPTDRVSCPECGEGDTLEKVLEEVGEYVKDKLEAQMHKALTDGLRGSKVMKVTSSHRPKQHRFVMDMD